MREIKFRVWDIVFKKMLPIACLYFDKRSDFVGFYTGDEENNEWTATKSEHIEIMQYTGLKDVNGKEIFIGDIVKREFEVWETTGSGSWEDGSLEIHENCIAEGYFVGVVHQTPSGLYVLNRCKKYNPDGDFIEKRSNIKLHARYANVIGNIYENPELLLEV